MKVYVNQARGRPKMRTRSSVGSGRNGRTWAARSAEWAAPARGLAGKLRRRRGVLMMTNQSILTQETGIRSGSVGADATGHVRFAGQYVRAAAPPARAERRPEMLT